MKKLLKKISISIVILFCVSTIYAGQKVNQSVNLGGNHRATWYLPDQTPVGWVFLQHGFNRTKDNIVDLATHLMDSGLIVLTMNCSVTRGNPALARKIGDDLVDNPPVPPNGFVLPENLILSGHSAGGLFVCHLGGHLVSRNHTPLKGLILLDPVDDGNGMISNMHAVGNFGLPVLAILANASSCNSRNNALQLMRNLIDPFVGIYLTDNSTHSDAEGASTGGMITFLCGSPRAHNVAYLKDFTKHWALDMARGTYSAEYYPGGRKINNLINTNDGVLIKESDTRESANVIVESSEEFDLTETK